MWKIAGNGGRPAARQPKPEPRQFTPEAAEDLVSASAVKAPEVLNHFQLIAENIVKPWPPEGWQLGRGCLKRGILFVQGGHGDLQFNVAAF
jgi:hypothetical protein